MYTYCFEEKTDFYEGEERRKNNILRAPYSKLQNALESLLINYRN